MNEKERKTKWKLNKIIIIIALKIGRDVKCRVVEQRFIKIIFFYLLK